MPEVLTREERIERLERQIVERRRRKVETTPMATAPPPAPEPEPEPEEEPVVMEPVPEEECTHPGMVEQEDGSWLCPVCGFRTPTPAEQLAGLAGIAVPGGIAPLEEEGIVRFQNGLRAMARQILQDITTTVLAPDYHDSADAIRDVLGLYLSAGHAWPGLVDDLKEKAGFTVYPTNEELTIWADYYQTLMEGIANGLGIEKS